jgi:predicted nuclease of predicted toxin-antitoxin system
MRFLIDEDLPRSVSLVISHAGYEAFDVRDIGLRGSNDFQIIEYARSNDLCLITADLGFSNIRVYPPHKYPGIFVLRLPAGATSVIITNIIKTLLKQSQIIATIRGSLAIVEENRIRIRKG